MDIYFSAPVFNSSHLQCVARLQHQKLYEDPTRPDLKFVLNLVLGMAGKRFSNGRFTTDEAEVYDFSNDVHEFLHGFLAKKQSASVELVDGFYPYPLYFMIYRSQGGKGT